MTFKVYVAFDNQLFTLILKQQTNKHKEKSVIFQLIGIMVRK